MDDHTRAATARAIYIRQRSLWLLPGFALALFDIWRNEAPSRLQPPTVFDVLTWLPWWAWLIVVLSVALILTFEGAHREIAAHQQSNGLRQLIKATPRGGENMRPTGGGVTSWEVDAYIDVETLDEGEPLRNCRIKLVDLLHRNDWTEKSTREVHVSWTRDPFYQGQTYFFGWSGRPNQVDAVDVPRRETATVARSIDTHPQWTTTLGAVGRLFDGDQYHLFVEITADNSLPLSKEYWLQMRQVVLGSAGSVIEDWEARERL